MNSVSVTITVGGGSEIHNHDLEYRSTLNHVHGGADDVIELIPYRPYSDQINDMMRPYIDDYNQRQMERYNAAWKRYNNGEIKTKPRNANYRPMNYDYYNEHINDTYFNRAKMMDEKLPMFRSMILGLGDQNDRQNGIINREQAISVFSGIINDWPEMFPNFKLLGATIHADECGFYHAHIDYKPLYAAKNGQGLDVGIGHESAMERMGLDPEQSIINASDKIPIRFNAFRNKLYLCTEKYLSEIGLRMEYDVSSRKDPDKNSSKNQRLENWQATRDAAVDIQYMKNHMLDIVCGDAVSPDGYKSAIDAADGIKKTIDEIEKSPKSRLNKKNVIVPFHLFDQLKSFVDSLMKTIENLLQYIDILEHNSKNKSEKLDDLQNENAKLKYDLQKYSSIDGKIALGKMEQELAQRRKFMAQNRMEKTFDEWKNNHEKIGGNSGQGDKLDYR